jgi:diketogulonate reductase-like aldo/keto reductase
MQAYSSLGCGKLLSHPLIVSVATEHRKAPSQILLKWALQHQASVIPKSVNVDHIAENAKLSDFVLTSDELEAINKLNEGHRFCWDPTNIC